MLISQSIFIYICRAVLRYLNRKLKTAKKTEPPKYQQENQGKNKNLPRFIQSLCASSISVVSAVWSRPQKTAQKVHEDILVDDPLLDKFVSTCKAETMKVKKNVILVTGGSGFLGQHIVKLLQEKCDEVTEIRVFDLKPYTQQIGMKIFFPPQTQNGVAMNYKPYKSQKTDIPVFKKVIFNKTDVFR